MLKTCSFTVLFIAFAMSLSAQLVIPLYAGKIPNSIPTTSPENSDTTAADKSIRISEVSNPTLTIYSPSKETTNGAAIIICPGGGYARLSMTNEGSSVAEAFAKIGVTAFVLKYRLPSDKIMISKETGPLQDAQEAIKLVRKNAREYGIDINKVGIIGFSAGGHLASTAGTHFTNAVLPNPDKINLRPDFMILLYPVINLTDSLMHKGSRDNLLGLTPSASQITLYSNDMQITKQTPPTFIVHAEDDKTVQVINTLSFYEGLVKNGVPAEMHIYPKGGHGFGLNNRTTKDVWMDSCKNWMLANGWLNAPAK